MQLLLLILASLYTPNLLFAVKGKRTSRKNMVTMPLAQVNTFVESQNQIRAIEECIQQHKDHICQSVTDFTVLAYHYEDARDLACSKQDLTVWQQKLAKCNKRKKIMLKIEQEQARTASSTALTSVSNLEQLWLQLRDTCKPESKAYAFYNNQAFDINERLRKALFSTEIEQLLSQETISHDDYQQILDKAEALFGLEAEEILQSIPSMSKIAMRSVAHTFHEQSSAPCTQMIVYEPAQSQLLPSLTVEQLIEKRNSLAACAAYIAQRLHNDQSFASLIDTLRQLKNTYSPLDPNYDAYTQKIFLTELDRLYHAGDMNSLLKAEVQSTDPHTIHHVQSLVARLQSDRDLQSVLQQKHTHKQLRDAYLDLLSTYDMSHPEHAIYANKIVRLDLKNQLEHLEDSAIDDLSYFNKRLRLTHMLAQTYKDQSRNRKRLEEDSQMLGALKNYTEFYDDVIAQTAQGITKANVEHTREIVANLCTYARYINRAFNTEIKTDWMEEKVDECCRYSSYFETLDALKTAQSTQQVDETARLLREVINSPLSHISEKKEHLVQLINITHDITAKIRLIRDELLSLGTLDSQEQKHWHDLLAHCYKIREKESTLASLTQRIHEIRAQLGKPELLDHNQQIALNKELAKCYAERRAIELANI